MDRKTLLTIALCFGIFLAWQKLYIEPRLPKQSALVSSQAGQTGQPGLPAGVAAAAQDSASLPNVQPQMSHVPAKTETLQSATGELVLGDGANSFVGWKLKDYRQGLSNDTGAIDIDSVTNLNGELEISFDNPSLAYLSKVQGNLEKTSGGARWTYEDANIRMVRTFQTTASSPAVDVKVDLQFKTQPARYAFVGISGIKTPGTDPEKQDRQLLYWSNESLDRVRLNDTVPLKEVVTPVSYIGVQNRYFLFAVLNDSPLEAKGLVQPLPSGAGRINFVFPVAGNSLSLPLKVYFGPKALSVLRSVSPLLDHTVDFGWFTPIAYPLLSILRWLYQFVKNYGVAIILLTVLLKVLAYPLTYKSMKSMKEMARIQPKLQELRDRYKDDKEALNRETLSIMKTHGYNPMAGCLPMLIQMPIFFALYRVLYSSIELYHAPFAFWIRDLSAHDPFYVTPVLMSILMFAQQKLSPNTATDPAQQKMLMMMPLIFGAFMLSLPSGLTIYMLVNAGVSIIQQLIMNKKLNVSPAPA